jgi:hypothetical protein
MVDIREAWMARINRSLDAMAVLSMEHYPWATQLYALGLGLGFTPSLFPLSLMIRPNE